MVIISGLERTDRTVDVILRIRYRASHLLNNSTLVFDRAGDGTFNSVLNYDWSICLWATSFWQVFFIAWLVNR